MKIQYPGIEGNVFVDCDDETTDRVVVLYGDPEGLRSLAKLLLVLADVDQSRICGLASTDEHEHVHLEPDLDLCKSSVSLVLGRADDKQGNPLEWHTPRSRRRKTIIHDWTGGSLHAG